MHVWSMLVLCIELFFIFWLLTFNKYVLASLLFGSVWHECEQEFMVIFMKANFVCCGRCGCLFYACCPLLIVICHILTLSIVDGLFYLLINKLMVSHQFIRPIFQLFILFPTTFVKLLQTSMYNTIINCGHLLTFTVICG